MRWAVGFSTGHFPRKSTYKTPLIYYNQRISSCFLLNRKVKRQQRRESRRMDGRWKRTKAAKEEVEKSRFSRNTAGNSRTGSFNFLLLALSRSSLLAAAGNETVRRIISLGACRAEQTSHSVPP